MVLKTTLCRFSGLRIYPGKGILFVRLDSQQYLFLNNKCKCLYAQRKRPAKLAWTTLYRKQHKKDQVRACGVVGQGPPRWWEGRGEGAGVDARAWGPRGPRAPDQAKALRHIAGGWAGALEGVEVEEEWGSKGGRSMGSQQRREQ